MHRFTLLCAFVLAACAAGCASRPAPRVILLGDGVFKSPTAKEAEAYCRNFGAPMRFLNGVGAGDPVGEAVYRCD